MRLVPLGDGHTPQRLGVRPFSENAEISPDGRWIAYDSGESGSESTDEIYVQPFPAVDTGRWQVSTTGGREPHWSRNGRELHYISRDRHLVAVPVQSGTTFSYGRGTPLFDARPYAVPYAEGSSYAVAADGRFLMMIRTAPTKEASEAVAPTAVRAAQIVVVDRWLDEVKARVK